MLRPADVKDLKVSPCESHLRGERVESEMRDPQDSAVAGLARRVEMLETAELDLGRPADEPLPHDLDIVFAPHCSDAAPIRAAGHAKGGQVLSRSDITLRQGRPFQPLHPKTDISPSRFGHEQRDDGKDGKPEQESQVFRREESPGARGSLPLSNIDFQAGSPPCTTRRIYHVGARYQGDCRDRPVF